MSWGVKVPGGHGGGDHVPRREEQLVKMGSRGLGSHQCPWTCLDKLIHEGQSSPGCPPSWCETFVLLSQGRWSDEKAATQSLPLGLLFFYKKVTPEWRVFR